MHFRVAEDRSGNPTWWLYGSPDQMVACAAADVTFTTPDAARLAASTFKEAAASARYEVFQDAARQWRWRARQSGDEQARELAQCCEPFPTQLAARRAAAVVRDHAAAAEGPWPG